VLKKNRGPEKSPSIRSHGKFTIGHVIDRMSEEIVLAHRGSKLFTAFSGALNFILLILRGVY